MKTPPDFDLLRELKAELDAEHEAGELTKEKYDEIVGKAEKAAGDFTPYLSGFLMLGAELGFAKRG